MSTTHKLWFLLSALSVAAHTFGEAPPTPPPIEEFDLDKELAALGPVGEEVQIMPTEIKLPSDAKLIIVLPLLGAITFTPMLNEKNVSQGFHAMIPSVEKPFSWGPLIIEAGEFKLTEGKLSYKALVTMFGKKATVGLKDFSLVQGTASHLIPLADLKSKKKIEVYRLVLGLTFDEGAVALELIPGKKIELKSIDLTFLEGTGVSFVSRVEFLGQSVDFSANIDVAKKELSLKAELYECALTRLVPELKGSFVDNLTLKGLISIDPLKGFIFTGSLMNKGENKFTVAGSSFDEAYIDIDTKKKRALVSGKTTILTLPIQGYFALFLGDNKGAKFAINIPSGVNDWKPFKELGVPMLSDVTLNSIRAGFYAQYLAATKAAENKQEKKLTPQEELAKKIKLEKEKAEKEKRDKEYADFLSKISKSPTKSVEEAMKGVKGKLEGEDTFAKISDAISKTTSYSSEIFDDVVKNGDNVALTAGEKGASLLFYVAGRSTILGVVSEVMLKLGTAPGATITASLFASLPEGWKLSQSFPMLASKTHDPRNPWDVVCDGIDLFKIDNAGVYASTVKETFNGMVVEPGFNIAASVSVDATAQSNLFIKGLIDNRILVGEKGASLELVGNVNPQDPKNASFKMKMSSGGFGFDMGPARFQAANLAMVIRAKPSIGVAGGFTMIPVKGEDPLDFYVDFSFTPIALGFGMSMKNIWKDPFGVKGFEFGNLAGNLTQTYTAIAEAAATFAIAAFVPASLGLTGEVKIGEGPCFEPDKPGKSLCAKAGFNLGKDISNLALFVDIVNPMSIVLLAQILLKQMNVSVDILGPLDQLVPIKVKKGKLYFVPFGTTIGEIKIQQGIGASLYLDLLGREAHVDGSIGLSGITLKGKMPAIDIGILKMTDFDETCKTTIVGNKTEEPTCGPTIDIQANAQNVHFIIDGLMQIGPLLKSKTKWNISTKGLAFETESFIGPEDKKLGVRIKGSSITFADQLQLFSLEPKDIALEIEFEDNLSAYLRETIINELKSSQKIFEESINQAMDQVARDTVQQDIINQEAAVKAAEGRRVWCKDDLGLCIKREFEVQGEIAKLNGLKLKMELEKSPIGKFFQDLGRKLGFDKVAKGFLMEVKKVGTGLNEGARLAFTDISRLVVIKKVSWKGSIADLGKGVIPSLDLIICTGCKEIKYTTPPFNLADPLTSIDAIGKTVIEIIKQVIIGTLRNEKCDNVCGTKESNDDIQNTELAKHILYWQKNGEIDEKGQRYDGDASRGKFLLEELRKTNPAAVAQLEPFMMPDVALLHARLDLLTHIRYWTEKGYTDSAGRHYDGDATGRGRMLLDTLRKLDPKAAAELEPKMLPDRICGELAAHNEYWRNNGGVDRDLTGKGQKLLAECKIYSPAMAAILEKEMVPVAAVANISPAERLVKTIQARAALDEHIAYWTKNGYTDSSGRHYDGDLTGKGRMLLEDLRALDPAAAAEYEQRMLPDRICGELAAHNEYWRKNGGVDRDLTNKGQNLLVECKRYSPAMGAILEKEMLPRG